VEGVGRLLDLDTEAAGWPWVGPWPLEPLGAPPESLLHSLSPELLVVVAEHVLGPPCLPRPHGDAQPGHADGARVQSRARARHGAWCLHQFLLSCEHVYRTITRFAMHARVEAGARMLINVGPTLHAPHPLAHTRHLERSARSALEFTAFSVALTQGVFKPCAEETYGHEWARMHTNLVVGFARLGFRKNALLARALERRDLALRHTHLGTNCTIQCTVHGGGAIVRAFDRPSKAWRHFHIQPANEHDRRGPVLPIIDVGDPNEPRITHYAPPAPYSWLSCLRACANTHWAVFAGMCVPDAVIAQNRDSFDESQWKWWIAIYNLHTGERLVTLETDPSCGSMKQLWMCVADDARTLELFALYVLPRDAHDLEAWKANSNTQIVRRTFALGADRRVLAMTESKRLPLHLGEPETLGRAWRYLVPGEDVNGDGSTWMRANEHGPVTVTRAISSSSSGSIVLTATGDVLAQPTVLKSVSECLTVRRVLVVDRALAVHHIRHTTGREASSSTVAIISPSGDHVVVTNRWHSVVDNHRAFIEVHARVHPAGGRASGGEFGLVARYDIDRARLRTRSFDVAKQCAFSPCNRFLLLFFGNATCAVLDIGECGHHSLLRFRSVCNPAPRFYGNVARFSNLHWNGGGIWLQTASQLTTTASGTQSHCTVLNLALY